MVPDTSSFQSDDIIFGEEKEKCTSSHSHQIVTRKYSLSALFLRQTAFSDPK